ncbi:hypothetical protein V6N13_025618 [Hibiscus sabdariffa]|uniref:Uncharacterized protein n=2 Tax=Hibiscus sabdariffa TaxID=183260 RepID=A0ABR2NAC1_9ROSI
MRTSGSRKIPLGSSQSMRTRTPFLRLLILAVMLATIHVSSCRQLAWALLQFSAENEGVLHRLVPGGPNPLHN